MDVNLWLRWGDGEASYEAPIVVPDHVRALLDLKFADAGHDWRSMRHLLWLAANLAVPVSRLAEENMPLPTPNNRQLAWAYARALGTKIPRAALADQALLAEFIRQAESVDSDELLQFLVSFDPANDEMMEAVLE